MNIQLESRSNKYFSIRLLPFFLSSSSERISGFQYECFALSVEIIPFFLYFICLNAHDLDTWALVTVAAENQVICHLY